MAIVTNAIDTTLDKLVVPGYSALGPTLRRLWWAQDCPPFEGRPDVVITGASSGLGRAAAIGLTRLGARVHIIGRSMDRLAKSADVIRAAVPDADVVPREYDVSDLDDVQRLVSALNDELVALRALVHCAGLIPEKRTTTAQGHELAFATHVLGPYALTTGLRELLAADRDGRAIWVSSGGMYPVPAVSRDLEYTSGEYKGVTAYARTKRMQVAMVEMLAAEFDRPGDPVVHSMHPGWAQTPGVLGSIPGFAKAIGSIMRTPTQGADTIVWLAAAPEPGTRSGLFWHDRRVRSTQYFFFTHDDPATRARLWDTCQMAAMARV